MATQTMERTSAQAEVRTYRRPCWTTTCANRRPDDRMYCDSCQRKLDAGWKYCWSCERWYEPSTHPEPISGGCVRCKARWTAIEAAERAEREAAKGKLTKVVYWRGFAVAYLAMPDGRTRLEPELRELDKLPKGKLTNLDSYVAGLTRDEVKRLQRDVMRVHGLHGKPQRAA